MKTLTSDFNRPKGSSIPLADYFFGNELSINSRQQKILTDLILCHVECDEQEHYLAQLPDLTAQEADNAIRSFQQGKW